jgi:hypothetical protein
MLLNGTSSGSLAGPSADALAAGPGARSLLTPTSSNAQSALGRLLPPAAADAAAGAAAGAGAAAADEAEAEQELLSVVPVAGGLQRYASDGGDSIYSTTTTYTTVEESSGANALSLDKVGPQRAAWPALHARCRRGPAPYRRRQHRCAVSAAAAAWAELTRRAPPVLCTPAGCGRREAGAAAGAAQPRAGLLARAAGAGGGPAEGWVLLRLALVWWCWGVWGVCKVCWGAGV